MADSWNKGKKGIYSEATLEKMRKAKVGKPSPNKGKSHLGQVPWNKGIPMTEEQRKAHSERIKKLWANPDFALKMLQALMKSPNKAESSLNDLLQEMYPGEWKFVGDGQVAIERKCPDFINVNGRKLIIELYGDYWHQDDDPNERISLFKQYGYETLIVWGKELKNKDHLIERIKHFVEASHG